jgi:YHS domain-containing protein
MRTGIMLVIAGALLLALLVGCGQKEEQAQMEKTTKEVQVVSTKVVDPVCGMEVDPKTAVTAEHMGQTYHFCSAQCQEQFLQDPAKYMAKKEIIDPVCGMKVDPETAIKTEYEGKTYHFCSAECKDKFLENPKQYAYCEDHDRLHKGMEGHDPKCKHHQTAGSHQG